MKRFFALVWLCLLALAAGIAPVIATGTIETGASAEDTVGPVPVEQLVDQGEPIREVGRYAEGFRAFRNGDLTILRVDRPWQGAGDEHVLHYVLYPRDTRAPEVEGAHRIVATPIESIITMSTTFLPHLEALDEMGALAGMDSVAFAYAPGAHERFEDGSLVEVGSGPGVDVEQVLAVNPDLVLVNSFGGEWDAQPVLEEADAPVAVSGDWVETTPLGRAEWLLFTALFFDKLDVALARMERIASEYERLADLAAEAAERPTVLINAPFQGSWALAGGQSYAARFIRDAGGDYVWSDDETTGSLFFDIESVFAEAGDADVWINPGQWTNLEQGAAEDERFTEFAAFEAGRVYNHNRRIGPAGGNDYFESGAANPHVVLNDLIWVFHPELVPNYEPFYYQQLR